MRGALCVPILLLLGAGCFATERVTEIPLPGSHVRLAPQILVIEDEGSWNAFWANFSKAPAPSIDFTHRVALVVADEQKPASCYSLSVELLPSGLIRVIHHGPSGEMACAAVIVFPFGISSLERTGAVWSFENRTVEG